MSQLSLSQRILEVNKEVTSVVKDATVNISKTRSYDGVSHDAVTAVLGPSMTKHGILMLVSSSNHKLQKYEKEKFYDGKPDGKVTEFLLEMDISLVLMNADDKTDTILLTGYAYATDSSDKASGKALSMGTKNLLLKAFKLESLDKEEARDTEEGTSYEQRTPQPKKEIKNYAPQAPKAEKVYSNPSNGVITEAMIKRMYGIARDKGWTKDQLYAAVQQGYQVEGPGKLKPDDYKEFVSAIEAGQTSEQIIKAKRG